MTKPRAEIVIENESGVYHCTSRCVRRAFLCGIDRFTGKDFSHRKNWIKTRLQKLAETFSVQILGYAVMSNHLHVIIQTQIEEAKTWTPEETAARWLKIFPRRRDKQGNACEPTESEIKSLTADKKCIKKLCTRLHSVSWFMRCLNEHIARMANREDDCRGRFWEGRFKCQRLLDEGAVLACMAYIDLNPIRAKVAKTLEQSTHTSVHDRITASKAEKAVEHLQKQQHTQTLTSRQKQELEHKQTQAKAADWLGSLQSPIIPFTFDEYLQLLDWTGRQIKSGKRGRIPAEIQPILTRMQLDHKNWLKTVESYRSIFWRVAGKTEAITKAAGKAGRKWLKGVLASKSVFTTPTAS